MTKPTVALVLVLMGCGSDHSESATSGRSDGADPGVDALRSTPMVGRAIKLTTQDGVYDGQRIFDVAEVRGARVRLKASLRDQSETGVWLEWDTVLSWVDVGEAIGDDRFLGLPIELGYDGE